MNYFAIACRITQEREAHIQNHPNECPICGMTKDPKDTICENCRRREKQQLEDATGGRR